MKRAREGTAGASQESSAVDLPPQRHFGSATSSVTEDPAAPAALGKSELRPLDTEGHRPSDTTEDG